MLGTDSGRVARRGRSMMKQYAAERQSIATTLVPTKYEKLNTAGVRRRKRRLRATALLISSDISLALLLWEVAYVLQSIWGRGALPQVAIAAVIAIVVAWVGLRALLGLYPGYGLDQVEELRRQTHATAATAATAALFAIAFQVGDLLSRLLLASGFLGLLLLAPLVRYLVKSGMNKVGLWGKPVVILGSGEAGAHVTKLLQQEWQLGYVPVAFFDHRLVAVDGPPENACEENLLKVAEMVGRQGVDTAIFAMPHTRREHLAELVSWASATFQHVLVTPNLGGITNSAVVARDIAGTFAVEIKHNLLSPWALRAKRFLDLGSTIIGGILILPLFLALVLLVFLDSRGPVFYRDWRMGRDGKPFSCLKFRTMVPNAEAMLQLILEEDAAVKEEYSKHHKLRNDPRVTHIGRFLRKTSLDELPQLWNVVRGEMSLVGPRPYLLRESERVGIVQGEILRVPPGITGPWQVAGRNHAFFEDRVRMDAHYIRDWSVWLDLVILARTVKSVVLGHGAY